MNLLHRGARARHADGLLYGLLHETMRGDALLARMEGPPSMLYGAVAGLWSGSQPYSRDMLLFLAEDVHIVSLYPAMNRVASKHFEKAPAQERPVRSRWMVALHVLIRTIQELCDKPPRHVHLFFMTSGTLYALFDVYLNLHGEHLTPVVLSRVILTIGADRCGTLRVLRQVQEILDRL